ncbi:MAG: 7TM diverse intracellular signaling domain-containing protein [Oligoflexus sp.]
MKSCFLLVILICQLCLVPSLHASTDSLIKQGILDLRNWDAEQQDVFELKGDWEFYWSNLLDTHDFKEIPSGDPELIQVPGAWNLVKEYPQYGYASYRLRVRLKEPRLLALHWPTVYSSARIYIDDQLLVELGKVGEIDEKNQYQPRVTEKIKTFLPREAEFDIVIQAANFDMFLGGMATGAPFLGAPEAIYDRKEREVTISFFLVGSLFIMGMYHFCLFALRTKSLSALYFGLICFTAGSYMLAAKGRAIATFIPEISYTVQIKLFNVWLLGIPAFAYFTYELFPKLFSKKFAQSLAVFNIGFFIYAMLSEPRDFLPKTIICQISTFVLCCYALFVAIKAVYRREEGARLFLGGVMVFGGAITHDMLLTRGIITSIPLGAAGMFSFIFFQSFLLAKKFSNAFVRVEHSEKKIRKLSDDLRRQHSHVLSLNDNLEQMVEEKTRDIKSIMANIKLGIFAITSDEFKIHKDYSEHLKEIFEVADLTELNACEILFSRCNLSSDEINQAVSALDMLLGEDLIVYETNRHCLPREFKHSRLDESLCILEISWNPITKADGVVEKLLVTVRDVTALRVLEEEANDKKEELQFIGELVNVKPESFQHFIQNCHEFIDQNRKLINSQSIKKKDMETLKVLFINMHTMKGAARSLYFKKMTKIFHDVEQYYAVLQKDPRAVWDIDKMQRDLHDVEKIIETYETINKDKLGRKMSDEKNIELAESHAKSLYQNLLDMGRQLQTVIDDKAAATMKNACLLLFPHLYNPAESILNDMCQCLDTLAKDLDKLKPDVAIQAKQIFISRKGEDLLRKVFVHLLRNSMDHGLEKPLERMRKGKLEKGQLKIIMSKAQDQMLLSFCDDGKGLDLNAICAIAKQHSWLGDEKQLLLEQRAELVFRSGLSTASQVSDISGRGVGMGAVRNYLRQEGADIKIRLTQDQPDESGNYPFYFEILLPLNLFALQEDLGWESAA